MDALSFMVGLVAGILVFAELYPRLAAFVWSGEIGGGTLAELVGVPFWVLAATVVLMALAAFWLVARLERGQEAER